MKIAILNKYQGKVYRGAETFVSELSKRLSKDNEVEVLTSVGKLFQKRYDVVIPTNGRLQVFIVRLITWLTHSKMIVSGQSGPGLDDRINLWCFPDIFIGLTKYQSAWAKKVNPFIKVDTIPNGVDLDKFSNLHQPLKGDPCKVVLAVGAFTKEKRHELTIKAVAGLENVKLMIVGGGGDRKKEIEVLGKKLLSDKFTIMSVPHDEIAEVYKKADVLAFPSVPWESFGIVMLEAMASGLPVVANDDPIRCEIVGDAGILVDPTNIDKYKEALSETLDTNWGDKPRVQAEMFSWDEIAKKYENLFEEITKQK